MKTLPIRPVETLAATPVPTPAPGHGRNPGIVPPWLQHPGRNSGIVPPWLQRPTVAQANTGIVPPWLQDLPVGPDLPVGDDVPRILGANAPTGFDPTPVA
ncbi:MAG: hypothetical protein JWM86_476 [Thermoleophilia bacterium]|nr:hypothetical protein [Thermoleophilia bacterium]